MFERRRLLPAPRTSRKSFFGTGSLSTPKGDRRKKKKIHLLLVNQVPKSLLSGFPRRPEQKCREPSSKSSVDLTIDPICSLFSCHNFLVCLEGHVLHAAPSQPELSYSRLGKAHHLPSKPPFRPTFNKQLHKKPLAVSSSYHTLTCHHLSRPVSLRQPNTRPYGCQPEQTPPGAAWIIPFLSPGPETSVLATTLLDLRFPQIMY